MKKKKKKGEKRAAEGSTKMREKEGKISGLIVVVVGTLASHWLLVWVASVEPTFLPFFFFVVAWWCHL